MSVSKWRYTEACDGRPCCGDCDHCSFNPEEPEEDGFVTREADLRSTPSLEYYGRPLNVLQEAHPSRECRYPRCEECGSYTAWQGERYCTVPMVVSKQLWLMTADTLRRIDKNLAELENVVYSEKMGDRNEVLDV